MKFNSIFTTYLNCSDYTAVFKYLKDTLTDSITLWNYFVNWKKVLTNYQKIEVHLNTLNYLVGKTNIEAEFKALLQQNPAIINAIPILVACRTSSFKILTSFIDGQFQYKQYTFAGKNTVDQHQIDDAVEFAQQSGVLELFSNRTIKSIPDYVLGVEVGLDTNGRKNRGGDTMEMIVEELVKLICKENNFTFIKQATAERIYREWQIQVQVDKSSRRFDFAINNASTLYLIEVNFYGGGGSKLKATAGEYKGLFDFLSSQGHKFIWSTDELGWKTALNPLEETFAYIDYTLNLSMAVSGVLAAVIKSRH